jgi:carboxymethylenebutenolidase
MAFQRYLAEEVAIDLADGMVSRREALRRLALLGLGLPAASALLAACGAEGEPDPPASSAAASPPRRSASPARRGGPSRAPWPRPTGLAARSW